MTIGEIKTLMMCAAVNSVACVALSLRHGKAEWTAYFMQFAGMAGAFGCACAIVERVAKKHDPIEAEKFLNTQFQIDENGLVVSNQSPTSHKLA